MIVKAVKRINNVIGRLGENEARIVKFYVGDMQRDFPGCSFSVLNRRPNDSDAYPVNPSYCSVDGDYLLWTVMSGDLAKEGVGECEVVASVGTKIVKSEIYGTQILHALDGAGTPPEPWESWVQDVEGAADRAEAAATLLEHPGAEATTLDPDESATASYSEGTFTFGIPKGADGQDGRDGTDGKDGADGKDGKDGADGKDGQDGQPGQDGFSPVATVSKSGATATISITDSNGTTTAQISDGQNGQDGRDGQDGQPGVGVPAGGTDGQMLVKDGSTDYATKWVNQPTEAVWELIREDTVTYATETGIEITLDGNGNAFKLTDVVLMFETPQQANEAKKAGYGAYYFYYKDSNNNLPGLSGSWTQAANAAANGCVIHVENDHDMIFVTSQSYSSTGNANNLRRTYKEGFSGSQSIQIISGFYVHKVLIPGVTGTAHYKLYGKRKLS